ncbi:mevalonate kinase [Ornithobacterium rhinotracheale]|uniref:mevalonate kinase family protein n=1 Tax=Ornithobacterium rhinotracheale TaxID=28251 RepID=UPI00129C181B|nr:mevalonate kinase [Ornithobacterium rhinotracheale]MRJ07359.1 mevalonate kinase [Ornithobacterium rhinotracheale]UOH77958.1 mevalonate kinase [Ornithobacterium rhinotracheale]
MNYPSFFAKILLFGEYGIIENAKGLTIPYNFYKGTLKFTDPSLENKSRENLKKYVQYLNQNMPQQFDVERLNSDLSKGMFFDSNIPQGYGVGSSGALVAAIYDEYAVKKLAKNQLSKQDISELKKTFAQMESYFHGKSSGIDPLICYMNIPLLIHSKEEIDTIGIPQNASGKGAVFLINSGAPGETEPMVQIFFQKLKQEGFRKTLRKEFTKYNDACIDALIKGKKEPLFRNLKSLSTWAFIHFKPMIPKKLISAWERGIKTNDYYLKLCGSGGGGYVLGFAEDFEKAQKALSDFQLEPVYRF